ncbi:predicted protein [Naegleria gruberi]|uniref:Conserved oligomeric Golgi complex subunit 7 n=1 Tax=Naegleria gruberi TaxID=5762 RepID=D2VAU8_NAEGR|nr:uncharacterized protein NAEGRDRAFT_48048 [Naegleria gruberi]EFC46143.1 predicted protein [Naegleria gruberi]|eukprot:XP_002678887.1 predicted protein [Naegleria gruberi strain NEG-M]
MAISSILVTLEQSKSLTKSMQQLDLLFRDKVNNLIGTTTGVQSSPSLAKSPVTSPNMNNSGGFNEPQVEISMETLREMTNQICCVEEGVKTLEPYSEKVKTKSKPKLLQYKEKLIKTLIGGKFISEMMESPEKKNIEACRELIELVQRIDSSNGVNTIFELYYEKNYKEIIEQQKKQQQFFNQILYILKQEDLIYRKLFQSFSSPDEIRTNVKVKLVEFCFKHKNCSLLQTEDLQQLVMNQYRSTKTFFKQLDDLSKSETIQKLLFEPYATLQAKYLSTQEKDYLLKQVRPHLSMSDNFVECIDEALNFLFTECENALERCITFTYGIESQSFIKVINQVFDDFGQSIKKTVSNEINKSLKNRKVPTLSEMASFSVKDRELIQNALKLFELVNDKDQGVKKKLEELEEKIKTKLLEVLKEVLAKNMAEYYVKIQTEQTFKQLSHFYNSLQETQFPIFSMASKSVDLNILQPSQELVKTTLVSYISTILSSVSTKYTSTNYYLSLQNSIGNVEYVDDIHLPDLEHSIHPSKYISQVGEYLIKLPEQLEILKNDDHVSLWIENICKETLILLSEAVSPPKNGEKHQIQQWNADVRYLKHILVDVLDYQEDTKKVLSVIGK